MMLMHRTRLIYSVFSSYSSKSFCFPFNWVLSRTCYNCASKDERISSTLEYWHKRFIDNDIPEPNVNAEYIIAHVLGKKTLYNTDLETWLTKNELSKITSLCSKRLDRTPLQYILQEWDFHDLTLTMRPPVLIPRPETEELADFCSATLKNHFQVQKPLHLLEIGSGSGALSILLLKRFKNAHIVTVDISPEACELTRDNAQLCGVENRITVLQGDFTEPNTQADLHSYGPFFIVMSNPPYVTTKEMEELEPEISRFEDHRALHGGLDGLDLIKIILLQAPTLLSNDGHLWLETGHQHADQVKSYVATWENLEYVKTERDFSGKERFCHLKIKK